MGFRTVVVTSCSKCSYKNNYMVIQNETVSMIHLSEIDVVILDTTSVSITGVLLSELSKNKIVLLCCNERHMPSSIHMPLYSNVEFSGRFRTQIKWNKQICNSVWNTILRHKISSEIHVLKFMGLRSLTIDRLSDYLNDVGDIENNREGLAAKIYFSALFGEDFIRHEADGLNAALDYGYAMILSLVTREIVSYGFLPALGIHHDNNMNSFNLACDLMEPFRAIVDYVVALHYEGIFDSDLKKCLWSIPDIEVIYKGRKQYLSNAIKGYCHSVLGVLDNGECSDIEEVYYPC